MIRSVRTPLASLVALVALALGAPAALAWSNHAMATYRALEQMPEVTAAAPVAAEPLEDFLRAEEKAIQALLAEVEAWAPAHLDVYPPLPPALKFVADPTRTDEARRMAFLRALRVALDFRFALYLQPDPWRDAAGAALGPALPVAAVVTPASAANDHRFVAIRAGEPVPPLMVVASAADEPDYGLDIGTWEDSASPWGKEMGMGPLPFGNPALVFATQAPFHMGFYHESRVIYMAAPQLQRTFVLLRSRQFTSLAQLAFRTGHAYWGWRFTGLALHYLQDLTQPYHATVMPGASTVRMIWISLLAKLGMPRTWDETVVLLSNRHLAMENFESALIRKAARERRATANEQALHDASKDAEYPAWSERYLRDVVSAQSQQAAARLNALTIAALPARLVDDPAFDYGAHEKDVDLMREIDDSAKGAAARGALEQAIAELLGNFGAHTRNQVRAVLKAAAGGHAGKP